MGWKDAELGNESQQKINLTSAGKIGLTSGAREEPRVGREWRQVPRGASNLAPCRKASSETLTPSFSRNYERSRVDDGPLVAVS